MTVEHQHDDRPATLIERVTARAEGLTASEATVARFFVDHPEDVAFLTAASIASRLEVSDATVIRAAQALGYAGLPDLKRELKDTLRQSYNPALRYSRSITELDGEASFLDGFIDAQIDLLTEARETLSPEAFETAVDYLAAAQRIVVLGLGPNRHLAHYFVQSVRRIGRHAIALTSRDAHVEDGLLEFEAGAVLLAVAYERAIPEITVGVEVATEAGVPVILLTDNLALAMKDSYTVALSARRGQTDTAPTVTVPLVALEALAFGVAGRDQDRTVKALDRMKTVRDRLHTR